MPVFPLDDSLYFPPTDLAERDGLLAFGGDLSPSRLLLAYRNGIFPWYSEDEPILWYCPKKRFVLFPADFVASSSLLRLHKQEKHTVSFNKAFEQVIESCATIKRKNQDGTWIVEDMKRAYTQLHQLGHAVSVEIWNEQNKLVGGVYGVLIGRFFAGESMFSLEPNTSKLALYYLTKHIDIGMIDCQMKTAHLARLGGKEISKKVYLKILEELLT